MIAKFHQIRSGLAFMSTEQDDREAGGGGAEWDGEKLNAKTDAFGNCQEVRLTSATVKS